MDAATNHPLKRIAVAAGDKSTHPGLDATRARLCALGMNCLATRGACLWVIFTGWLLPRVVAQPLVTPDAAVLNCDEVGLYAVGYAYRGQPEVAFPPGWSGFFEDKTGVACLPYGQQNGKRVFFMHSPWRGGTGITFQQFNFSLLASARRIVLRGATAMKSDIVAQSDGVTFRVLANGVKQLERHQTNAVWQPFEFDLTAWRGSNVLVRFEVDPGPASNASFDYSFWGDRELVLEGYSPPAQPNPAPIPLLLTNVLSTQNGEVAPAGGYVGKTSVNLSDDVVCLRYAGPDGVMEYRWHRPVSGAAPLFGALTLNAQMAGQAPVSVPLASFARFNWTLPAKAVSSVWEATNGGYVLARTFEVGGTNAVVRIAGRLVGKSLVLAVNCDQPCVSALEAGDWGPTLRRRQVVTPYYLGAVHYLPHENLFTHAFLDWTKSAASYHEGTTAGYGALTDGTRNRLSERIVFTAAWHLPEVLPNIPNPPSPWREFLADKIVLDIWGGSFTNIADNLVELADYGVTNCVAIIHNWQRDGYDNALPAHYPANAQLGGDAGMRQLVATGNRLGVRVALHENYVDYYPNYEGYTTNDLALDSEGRLVKAWFNEGTGIQSFAIKSSAILPLAEAQSPEIHRRYDTKANYLDVHSAVPPWFHVDFRAGEPGAGRFAPVFETHRRLWAYERATHQGPTFGEGNRHWYWSGLLDGAEAQFGTGWTENGGLTAPLSVDFDLLKVHPLQFNHGMGYYERWWPKGYDTNWAALPPMVVLDQYRMQEVAYGHAGFLAGSTYSQVPLAWLEQHLLSPVMARYATAKPVDIRYEANGAWLDATAMAKQENGGTHSRVRVTYDNGLVITANSDTNMLRVGDWELPQFGWLAVGASVKAGTVLRGGVITDFSETGDTLFVNARAARDWSMPGLCQVRPRVAEFQQTGNRAFRAAYQWDVRENLRENLHCFVHFVSGETIRWQQDHGVTPPTPQWQAGQVVADGPWTIAIPPHVADGDYVWDIGLFERGTGVRQRLLGVNDGTARIRLGVVQVRSNGAALAFLPETGEGADPTAWYRQHLNLANAVVDFGSVRTDGSVLLRREGDVWSLKTWPRDQKFTLEFDAKRFAKPAQVQCIGGAESSIAPTAAVARWRLPLNGAGDYRWTASGGAKSAR